MRIIKKGATSQSIYFEVLDSTSTTGARKTGLVFNSSGLTAYYVRNQGSATSITLATLTNPNSAYSSGGFKEVDATNMPGIYRLDLPDAAVVSGADSVVVTIKGVTGMVQVSEEIQLVSVDFQPTTGKIEAVTSIRTGTAQAGASSTITLDTGASATDNFYNNHGILIVSGTGSLQAIRRITGYVGSSKVASVSPVWTTNPSSDSVFIIVPLKMLSMYVGNA